MSLLYSSLFTVNVAKQTAKLTLLSNKLSMYIYYNICDTGYEYLMRSSIGGCIDCVRRR